MANDDNITNHDPIRVVNGKAVYEIPSNLGEGIYTITATYTDESEEYGTHHYASSSTTNTLTITKNALTFTIDDVALNDDTRWNDYIQPRVRIYRVIKNDDNKDEIVPIEGGEVSFDIGYESDSSDTISMGSGVTDSDGWVTPTEPFQLSQEVLPDLAATKHASYDGYACYVFFLLYSTSEWNRMKGVAPLTIYKRDLKVTLKEQGSVELGKKITFKGQVQDLKEPSDTASIKGLTITYYWGSEDVGTEKLTGVNFSYDYIPTTGGSDQEMKVKISESDLYRECTVSNKASIRQDVTITPEDTEYTIDSHETKNFEAKFTLNGTPLGSIGGITGSIVDSSGNVYHAIQGLTTTVDGVATYPAYIESYNFPQELFLKWELEQSDEYNSASAKVKLIHRRNTKVTMEISPDDEYMIVKNAYTVTLTARDSTGALVSEPAVVQCGVVQKDENGKEGETTSLLNQNVELTLSNGKATTPVWTIPYDFTPGHYYMQCNTSDTPYYKGDTEEIEIDILSTPWIAIDEVTCEESYEQSNKYLGSMYDNRDSVATISGTVYSSYWDYKTFASPLANAELYEIYLKYTSDSGVTNTQEFVYSLDDKTLVGRDSNGNAVTSNPSSVVTDKNGKFSIKYHVPCGVLNIDNTITVTMKEDKTGQYHTSGRGEENNYFHVRRYWKANVPSHAIAIGETTTFKLNNVMDSHGDDLKNVRLNIASDTYENRGTTNGSTLFSGQSSTDNAINYEYTHDNSYKGTVALTPETEYVLNCWTNDCTRYCCHQHDKNGETDDYVVMTSPEKSNSSKGVYCTVVPTIRVEATANPKDSSSWKSNIDEIYIDEGEILGLRAHVSYTSLGTAKSVTGYTVKFSYAGSNFAVVQTENGYATCSDWAVPINRVEHKAEITFVMDRDDEVYLFTSDIIKNFYVVRYMYYVNYSSEPQNMGQYGKLTINGVLQNKGSVNFADFINVQGKYSNDGSSDAGTLYSAKNTNWVLESSDTGVLDGYYDNSTSNTGRQDFDYGSTYYYRLQPKNTTKYNQVTGKAQYHSFKITSTSTTSLSSTVSTLSAKQEEELYTGFVNLEELGIYDEGNITLKARVYDEEGEPIKDMSNIQFIDLENDEVLVDDAVSIEDGLITTDINIEGAYPEWHFKVVVPQQLVSRNGVSKMYSEVSSEGYLTIIEDTYNIEATSSEISVVAGSDRKCSAVVHAKVTDKDGEPVKNKEGFTLEDYYSHYKKHYPIPDVGDGITNEEGYLTFEYDITDVPWYKWDVRVAYDHFDEAILSRSQVVSIYKHHNIAYDIYSDSALFMDDIEMYSPFEVSLWDGSLGRGDIEGKFQYRYISEIVPDDPYDMTGMGFNIYALYKGKEVKMNDDTLILQEDGILGEKHYNNGRQRKWLNTEIPVKGAWDCKIEPDLDTWTEDQKIKYSQDTIIIEDAVKTRVSLIEED